MLEILSVLMFSYMLLLSICAFRCSFLVGLPNAVGPFQLLAMFWHGQIRKPELKNE